MELEHADVVVVAAVAVADSPVVAAGYAGSVAGGLAAGPAEARGIEYVPFALATGCWACWAWSRGLARCLITCTSGV